MCVRVCVNVCVYVCVYVCVCVCVSPSAPGVKNYFKKKFVHICVFNAHTQAAHNLALIKAHLVHQG